MLFALVGVSRPVDRLKTVTDRPPVTAKNGSRFAWWDTLPPHSPTVTRFPAALAMGLRPPQACQDQGRIEAQELQRLGMNVNLAPCVDVLAGQTDAVIGDRSYGADPRQVSSRAVARIEGLQSHGVAACAKHFPGLGAVPKDPHRVLPAIALNEETMRSVHLMPFHASIGAGVAMIMSSHVCYPGLGESDELPATFSSRLIRGWLRTELQFQGLILTDDLEMGALGSFGSMGEIAVRATQAGHDLLLVCSDLGAAEEAAQALRQAYETGRLPRAELEASAARVEVLRRKFPPPGP